MKKNKLAIFAACAALSASMIMGCGGNSATTTAAQTTAAAAETTAAGGSDAAATELTAGMFDSSSILLTSVGQSADVNIVDTLMKKAGVTVTMNATADSLGGAKTLVLAIGGSSKGLGAAGIDENQELARVQGLIKEAQDSGCKVLALHIGGSARRGTLSDKFIPDALNAADAAIIVSEGDSDGLMSGILSGKGTPTAYIANQTAAIEPLTTVFSK